MQQQLVTSKQLFLFVFNLLLVAIFLTVPTRSAFADNITVTTTADQNNTDTDNCSLREAITLVNLNPDSNGNAVTSYGGCTSTAPQNATVMLKSGSTYLLTLGEITISKSLSIAIANSSGLNEVDFKKNATIKVAPSSKNRIFTINDGSTLTDTINVSMQNINLMGCSTTQAGICADLGGIIRNSENLQLSNLKISNGVANDGGAIYNEQNAGGHITVSQVEFYKNTATRGAAIYAAFLNFSVANSLFRENTATGSNGTIVFGDEISSSSEKVNTESAKISNSTFYNNKGFASVLTGNMTLNNTTIVSNTGGVLITAQQPANLANSIIAGNANGDCLFSGQTAGKVILNNIVYQTGCDNADVTTFHSTLTQLSASDPLQSTLFSGSVANPAAVQAVANDAGDYSDDQDRNQSVCAAPKVTQDYGLLCPLSWSEDSSIGFFKPRLLMDYSVLSDSVIVNKGNSSVSDLGNGAKICESKDQRNNDNTRILCDIGAIELVVGSSSATNGQDILYGQTATISLKDSLGDGQLIPYQRCTDTLPNIAAPDGGWSPSTDGCLRLAVDQGLEGIKGTLTLNSDSSAVLYTPSYDFHGYDDVHYYLTTTTTRFSDAINDRSIDIRTRIVMAPPDTIVSKTVNLKGGSLGLFSVFALFAFGYVRRLQMRTSI